MKIDDSREMMRIFESICQNDMLNEVSDVDVDKDAWRDEGTGSGKEINKSSGSEEKFVDFIKSHSDDDVFLFRIVSMIEELGRGLKGTRCLRIVMKNLGESWLFGDYPEVVEPLKDILMTMSKTKSLDDIEKNPDLDDGGLGEVDEGKKYPAWDLGKHPTKPAPKMPDQSKVKPAPEFKEDDETKARKQKYYDEHPNALD